MAQPAQQLNTTQTLISTNPAKGYAPLGEVKISSPEEIKAKVVAAKEAQNSWSKLSLDARKEHLERLAEIFKQNREDLVTRPSQEMGAPVGLTHVLANVAESDFKWFLENAEKALGPQTLFEDEKEQNILTYEPFGVMACIVAWNFPYPNFVINVIQPLLAGNTVVMKYSEEIPLFSKFMEELVAQAELPEGVLSFVYGDGRVGAQLVDEEIDMISFTGSYAVGHGLYKKAAEKFIPIINELGGSSPGVVFGDCDPSEVVERLFWGRFSNSGQFCDNMKRLIVHDAIFDEVVTKLAELAASKTIGDPLDKTTDLGPLVAARQVEKLESQLQDALEKGAQRICGGARPENLQGAYFQPTILTNITPDMQVWHEEVFGPVLPVVSFSSYDEAIRLANDTIYGLTGYVYTHDKQLAQAASLDIKAGAISGLDSHFYRPHNPYGGFKKSGLGRNHGLQGYHQVAQTKVIARSK